LKFEASNSYVSFSVFWIVGGVDYVAVAVRKFAIGALGKLDFETELLAAVGIS
jgi:hypothetical protein